MTASDNDVYSPNFVSRLHRYFMNWAVDGHSPLSREFQAARRRARFVHSKPGRRAVNAGEAAENSSLPDTFE